MEKKKDEPDLYIEDEPGPEHQDCAVVCKISGTDPHKECYMHLFLPKEDSTLTPYQRGLLWIQNSVRDYCHDHFLDNPDSDIPRFERLADFEGVETHPNGTHLYNVDYESPEMERIGIEWFTSYDFNYFIGCPTIKNGYMKLTIHEH